MYKKYVLIFLLFALQRLAAQTWIQESVIKNDFTTTIYVNYGDSASLLMYDRWGNVRKTFIDMSVYRNNIVKIDTFLNLSEGVYIAVFKQSHVIRYAKQIYYVSQGDSVIHFTANLIINPESIPAETFIAYPNPVENGEINLLYSQDWTNGIVTISNNIGQILFTKSLTEIQNNQLKINDLPVGNYILTVKTDTKHHNQLIVKK